MTYKLFIVEDHPVMRSAYVRLLDRQPDFEVCGEAEDAPHALDKLAELAPDLILVDVSLPGMSGIELIKRLKVLYPALPALVISGHTDVLYAKHALQVGAKGYVDKAGLAEIMIEAIHQVLQGSTYVSRELRDKLKM